MGRQLVGVAVVLLAIAGCSGESPRGGARPAPETTVDASLVGLPCPEQRDECLELGVLADANADGKNSNRIQAAQEAFWARVNEQGGIGGRPVSLHRGAEIDGGELAFLATSEASAPPLGNLPEGVFVAGTLPLSSRWLFEDRVLQTGGSVCIQAMNAVDVLAFRGSDVGSVAVVHLEDELGRDAAAGAQLVAARRGIPFESLEAAPGAAQDAVISRIVDGAPDVVVLAMSPVETGVIAAGLVDRGFPGELVTTSPGWERSLVDAPPGDVLAERLVIASSWREFTLASAGHAAMRAALGEVVADDAYTAGWIGNYPLLELLRAATESGDLTRSGLVDAAASLDDVDYEGMYPPAIGTPFSGGPTAQVAMRSAFEIPDSDSPTATSTIEDYFNGLTAARHEFRRPCFEGFEGS